MRHSLLSPPPLHPPTSPPLTTPSGNLKAGGRRGYERRSSITENGRHIFCIDTFPRPFLSPDHRPPRDCQARKKDCGFVDSLQNIAIEKLYRQLTHNSTTTTATTTTAKMHYGFFCKIAGMSNLIRWLAILQRTPQRSGNILHLLPRPPSPRGIVRVRKKGPLKRAFFSI